MCTIKESHLAFSFTTLCGRLTLYLVPCLFMLSTKDCEMRSSRISSCLTLQCKPYIRLSLHHPDPKQMLFDSLPINLRCIIPEGKRQPPAAVHHVCATLGLCPRLSAGVQRSSTSTSSRRLQSADPASDSEGASSGTDQ